MSEAHVPRDERRRLDNEDSKKWARRDGVPWDADEDDFIIKEWILTDPSQRDEVTISQLLERTIVACRRRAEEIREVLGIQGSTWKKRAEPTYIGAEDDPEDQWWSPDYYSNGGSHA